MYHPVYTIHKRPLVVRTGVDYRFTSIVVDLVDAVDGRYEVLFLGTGESCYLGSSSFFSEGEHQGLYVSQEFER